MTKSRLVGTTLLLCCYPAANAQTGECGAISATAKVADVGAFSNMRHTEEHAYGYSVMLWRAEGCLFGLFESSEGLAGDTPIGELQRVKYDQKNGRLSFSAKLTMGLVSLDRSKGMEPSEDLFAFDGYLRATRLMGVVTHAIRNYTNLKQIHNKVVLRPSKQEVEFMRGAANYREWREKWQPVLRARGPKW